MMLTCHGLPRMLTMLNPSSQLSIPNGDAFDFSSLERLSQRFDDGVVPFKRPPSRGYSCGAIGDQLQVTAVGVRRRIREECRSVRGVYVLPDQFPVDVPRREISPPRIVVARLQTPGGVTDGVPRPRLGKGDGAGVGDYVLDGDQFDPIVSLPSAIARVKTAHE